MDKLDPVKAPPPIPRAPATRRERRRHPNEHNRDKPARQRDERGGDEPENEHTIDEYV